MTFTDKTVREIVAAFDRERKKPDGKQDKILFDDEGFGFRLQGDSRTGLSSTESGSSNDE